MSATLLANVADQVQTFWSDIFVPEFLEMSKLPALVSREYEGEIKEAGNTVKVSQIVTPTAVRKTIGTPGYENYSGSTLQTQQAVITADTIIEAGVEIGSIAQLQSQIKNKDSEIRRALLKAIDIEMNNWLYGFVNPSSATPDHVIDTVTDFNTSQVLLARKIAADAHWPEDERWLLASSSYINDMLATAGLTSGDFVSDNAVLTGRMVAQRFGLNILEDNTFGMRQLSPTGAADDLALLFNPSFLYLVMQMQPTFKLSDLHGMKKRGYFLTCEIVCGAKEGIDAAVKHAKFYNT